MDVESSEEDWDSDDPFSEWDQGSEEELFKSAPKKHGRTVRITQFVPTDSVSKFHGKDDSPEEAKDWLKTFNYVAEGAGWSDEQIRRAFHLYMKGNASSWLTHLPSRTKKKWSEIQKAFRERYCKHEQSSAKFRYHNVIRRSNESPTMFLDRLNGLATKAGIRYRVGQKEARDHVMQFIVTANDENLAKNLMLHDIPDVSALYQRLSRMAQGEKRMKMRDRVLNPKTNDKKLTPYTKEAGAERFVRRGARVNVAEGYEDQMSEYSAWSNGDVELPSSAHSSDSEDAEAFIAAGGQSRSLLEDVPICKKCNKGRHLEKDCYLNKTCTYCKRTGHSQESCYFVCKACMMIHRTGECSYRLYLDALSSHLAKQKKESLPTEVQLILKKLNL
jgi:hypothetical protein